MKGIITGDIINSTAIPIEHRRELLSTIESIARELQDLTPFKYEMFRGDSFQIMVEKPEKAMCIAVLVKAGLKSRTPEECKILWDARIAVGIGDVSYEDDKLVTSDGEAFHFSGREFDELGKRNLSIRTRWEDINDELNVSTAFANDIIDNWTRNQAQIVYISLTQNLTQKEIALKLGKSKQNISKLFSSAKEALIRIYLKRIEHVINSKK